jgi:hypothetical protein
VTQHYTKNTVFATAFCKKCSGFTRHRIDGGRQGPCTVCLEKLEAQHQKSVSAAAAPVGLFGAPVAAAAARAAETTESKEAKEARARAAALTLAAKTTLDLFSASAPSPEPEPEPAAVPASSPIAEDPQPEQLRGTKAQELEFAEIHEFVMACNAGGFQYRGYANNAGDRVYEFSRAGAPEAVFYIRKSKWDRTPGMLEREVQRTERWL